MKAFTKNNRPTIYITINNHRVIIPPAHLFRREGHSNDIFLKWQIYSRRENARSISTCGQNETIQTNGAAYRRNTDKRTTLTTPKIMRLKYTNRDYMHTHASLPQKKEVPRTEKNTTQLPSTNLISSTLTKNTKQE